eukprot:CAMPEP_0177691858 /NCGR_PEP_ID=MMETSP0484_2-20121128/1537_1 /TAXON_ID=354590 /ORGANISM="Rhodomonas lens, Strain RHODO" /LENGTH=194 /DNA_ID=CAMNT_0019202523 /DNA_START=263 /DNA_END=848 /DNA_ORIENTATION=-
MELVALALLRQPGYGSVCINRGRDLCNTWAHPGRFVQRGMLFHMLDRRDHMGRMRAPKTISQEAPPDVGWRVLLQRMCRGLHRNDLLSSVHGVPGGARDRNPLQTQVALAPSFRGVGEPLSVALCGDETLEYVLVGYEHQERDILSAQFFATQPDDIGSEFGGKSESEESRSEAQSEGAASMLEAPVSIDSMTR